MRARHKCVSSEMIYNRTRKQRYDTPNDTNDYNSINHDPAAAAPALPIVFGIFLSPAASCSRSAGLK